MFLYLGMKQGYMTRIGSDRVWWSGDKGMGGVEECGLHSESAEKWVSEG